VLKAANTLIANNDHVFKKALWSDLGYGDPIRVLETRNEEHEAQQVISELISHRFKHRTRYSDYAILYRGNHQSRLFEKMLREQNVPYFLSGGNSFFAYSEVRDIMSYLRLLVNNDDDAAFLRVVNTPRREIGASTVEKLGTYANSREISLFAACFELGLQAQLAPRAVTKLQQFAEWLTHCSDRCNREDPVTVIRDVVRTIDYETWLRDISANEKAAERRIANVNELLDWMKRLTERDVEEKSLADLVNHMTLMDILQRNDENEATDQVCLMTLHAAKGLEFPHVFIVGMEEDLLPHRTSIEEDGIEEERRLAYVGITRAQKSLTFSYAVRRKRAGELSPCEPSRFLAELPEDDLEWQGKSHVADPEQRQEKGQAHLANLRGLLGTAEPVT
jgi:ATP-dependent DNA helicase Rep